MSLIKLNKILIACRGEIACRIARTAKRLGIETVAVYSEADRHALHVKLATEAYCLGPSSVNESYGDVDKILTIAMRSRSEAVHPGYGCLPQTSTIAENFRNNGLMFIGPPSSVLKTLRDRKATHIILSEAGVPLLKCYYGKCESTEVALKKARKIGFPLILRFLRDGCCAESLCVETEEAFCVLLFSGNIVFSEILPSTSIFLQKIIKPARHFEVPVCGDKHGNFVYLPEIEVSVQHQYKSVIIESPAPFFTQETRHKIGNLALKAAKAVGLVGVGTVEFIMDPNQDFYCMGMKPGRHSERPIIESVTGFDLVEWELRIEVGEKLPVIHQQMILPRGHAFQTSIFGKDYSDPNVIIKSVDKIVFMRFAECSDNVRIDFSLVEGDEVTMHYDHLIAKLTVWDHCRLTALQQMMASLSQFQIVGLATNIEFLQSLIHLPAFINGKISANLIADNEKDVFVKPTLTSRDFCIAGFALAVLNRYTSDEAVYNFNKNKGARKNIITEIIRWGELLETVVSIEEDPDNDNWLVSSEMEPGKSYWMSCIATKDESRVSMTVVMEDTVVNIFVFRFGLDLHLFQYGHHRIYTNLSSRLGSRITTQMLGWANACGYGMSQLQGVVTEVLIHAGDRVRQGDILVRINGLKLEYAVNANCDGEVEFVKVEEGQFVGSGCPLYKLKPDVKTPDRK